MSKPGRIAGHDGIRFGGTMVLAIAMGCFAVGAFLTRYLVNGNRVQADGNRAFELMIYHTVPGKEPELESIFRDVSKMQEKYGLKVLGYWVPNEDPEWKDTFIYLVAHPSREAADKNWKALHADPAFPPYREAAKPLLQKSGDDYRVDEVYMRPTAFSELR